jgi:hypothetical protein
MKTDHWQYWCDALGMWVPLPEPDGAWFAVRFADHGKRVRLVAGSPRLPVRGGTA